jgi:hypothetical protein
MTATDPRLAALAAALHAEAPLPASIWSQSIFVGWAAAALRSLPPDWCGHLTEMAALAHERDLAIAHDRQPYPTAHAYEQVCRVRNEQAATIAQLRADVERERAFVIAGQARENEAEREIDTLRAALDGLVEAADRLLRTVHGEYCGSDLGVCRPCADDRDTIAVAKEAIAAAGETTDV